MFFNALFSKFTNVLLVLLAQSATSPMPAQEKEVVLPEHQKIVLDISTFYDNDDIVREQSFVFKVAEPVVIDGLEIISAGATCQGRVKSFTKDANGVLLSFSLVFHHINTKNGIAIPLREDHWYFDSCFDIYNGKPCPLSAQVPVRIKKRTKIKWSPIGEGSL